MMSVITETITTDTHVIWSIPKVRRYIGWIGFLFPLGLFFGHLFLDPPNHTLDAISDYHYSESMHHFLVVGVLALGVLLIYYEYKPVDTKMSTFANASKQSKRFLRTFRKATRLPRHGAALSRPPEVTPGEENLMRVFVRRRLGSVGQRDQLPYTPAFDDIARQFNRETSRNLDNHAIWRLIAKVSK